MSQRNVEIDRLEALISASPPAMRYRQEPQLRQAIARLRENGQAVPERIRRLHAALLSEAIEAEFDNMPV